VGRTADLRASPPRRTGRILATRLGERGQHLLVDPPGVPHLTGPRRGHDHHGGRGWTDYRVETVLTVHLAQHAGVAVRGQGLRRYYAALLVRPGLFASFGPATIRWSSSPRLRSAGPSRGLTHSISRSRATASRSLSARRLQARNDSALALRDVGIALVLKGGPAHATRRACAPRLARGKHGGRRAGYRRLEILGDEAWPGSGS